MSEGGGPPSRTLVVAARYQPTATQSEMADVRIARMRDSTRARPSDPAADASSVLRARLRSPSPRSPLGTLDRRRARTAATDDPRRLGRLPGGGGGRRIGSAGPFPAVADGGRWRSLVYDLLFTDPRFSLVVADPASCSTSSWCSSSRSPSGASRRSVANAAAEADRRAAEATGAVRHQPAAGHRGQTDGGRHAIVERLARDAASAASGSALDVRPARPLPGRHGDRAPAGPAGDRHDARPDARRRAGPLGPRPRARPARAGDAPTRRRRCHPGQDRDRRQPFGSLWAVVARRDPTRPGGDPAPVPRRRPARAGLRRDRLRGEATSAEIARRSDALKSALLDSVSHDLRTPLASIRATAGNLADPDVDVVDRRGPPRPPRRIDAEAQRLDRFVRSVLDLSRIDFGRAAARPRGLTTCPSWWSGDPAAAARARRLGRSTFEPCRSDLPLVRVDAVLLDAIVSNLLDNIAGHTPPATLIAVGDRPGRAPDRVRLTIEDGGPGVPPAELESHLRQVPAGRRTGRRAPAAGWASACRSSAAWPRRWEATARSRGRLGGLADRPRPPDRARTAVGGTT